MQVLIANVATYVRYNENNIDATGISSWRFIHFIFGRFVNAVTILFQKWYALHWGTKYFN